ncbi:MAG: hypothetical protein ACR2QM_00430 [Longimicrobiales bacterium]
MRKRHRKLHRWLTVLLALVSALVLFLAHRTWTQRPIPAAVDLTSTELSP